MCKQSNKSISIIKSVLLGCVILSVHSCGDSSTLDNNKSTIEPIIKTQFSDNSSRIFDIVIVDKDGSFAVLWCKATGPDYGGFIGITKVQTFDKNGIAISKPIVLGDAPSEGGYGPLITSNPEKEEFTVAILGKNGAMTLQKFFKNGKKATELQIGENKKESHNLNLKSFYKNNDLLTCWEESTPNGQASNISIQKFDANSQNTYDKVQIESNNFGQPICNFIGDKGDFVLAYYNGFLHVFQRFDQYGNMIGNEKIVSLDGINEIIPLNDNFAFAYTDEDGGKIQIFSNIGEAIGTPIVIEGLRFILPIEKSEDFAVFSYAKNRTTIQKFNKFGESIGDKIQFADIIVSNPFETKNGFFIFMTNKKKESFVQKIDYELHATEHKIQLSGHDVDLYKTIKTTQSNNIMIFLTKGNTYDVKETKIFVQKYDMTDMIK